MPTLTLAQSTAQAFNLSPDGKWVDLSRLSWPEWRHVAGDKYQFGELLRPHEKPRRHLVILGLCLEYTPPQKLLAAFWRPYDGHWGTEIPLERVPTRAAMHNYDWQFPSYRKGRRTIAVSSSDRAILLDLYADRLEQMLRQIRPIDPNDLIDLPNLDE
jgi:hypothetical protein